jgi:hypothetical protein
MVLALGLGEATGFSAELRAGAARSCIPPPLGIWINGAWTPAWHVTSMTICLSARWSWTMARPAWLWRMRTSYLEADAIPKMTDTFLRLQETAP